MSRTNAFGTMSGGNGRDVSLGGRAANDSLTAVLNTDTGAGSDCSLKAEVNVTGNTSSADRRKAGNGGDNRHARFTVTLPSARFSTHCDVIIRLDSGTDCATNVMLPGGHTLQYALECIAKVKAGNV